MANVLLVANDVAVAYRLRNALNRAGHAAFLSFDRRDALEIVEQHDIQVMVCDAVLPGTFGTDLIEAARARLQRPDLPAILLSALPAALSYELLDAEPVHVAPDDCSGEQLVVLLEQLGISSRTQDPRRSRDERLPIHTPRSTGTDEPIRSTRSALRRRNTG